MENTSLSNLLEYTDKSIENSKGNKLILKKTKTKQNTENS